MTETRPAPQIDTTTDKPTIQRIAPLEMFHTPANMAELEATAETYSGGEAAAFTMGMCLAWNLAASITEQNASAEADAIINRALDRTDSAELFEVIADPQERGKHPYGQTFTDEATASDYAEALRALGYRIDPFPAYDTVPTLQAALDEARRFFNDARIDPAQSEARQ